MIVVYGIVFLYLFLPVIGEWYALRIGDVSSSAGEITFSLLFANLIFSLIVFSTIYFFSRKKLSCKLVINRPDQLINRCFWLSLVVFCFVFYAAGYKFLFLHIDRGVLRTSMGWYGFLYTWIINYIIPILLVLAYACVIQVGVRKSSKRKFYFILLCLSFCAILTGYKAVLVLQLMPMLSIFFMVKKRSVFALIKYAFFGSLSLVMLTMLVRSENFITSFYFVIYRLTFMTAYGAVGAWNEFPEGASFSDVLLLFWDGFGVKLTTLFLGIDASNVDVIKTNLSRMITYLVYPNQNAAITGTANVTVTNFGEAIYILGRHYFWVYAFLVGAVIAFVVNKLKFYFSKNDTIKLCMLLAYFFAIVLPWLNSSGFSRIFGFTTFIYLSMTYFFLVVVLRGRFKV